MFLPFLRWALPILLAFSFPGLSCRARRPHPLPVTPRALGQLPLTRWMPKTTGTFSGTAVSSNATWGEAASHISEMPVCVFGDTQLCKNPAGLGAQTPRCRRGLYPEATLGPWARQERELTQFSLSSNIHFPNFYMAQIHCRKEVRESPNRNAVGAPPIAGTVPTVTAGFPRPVTVPLFPLKNFSLCRTYRISVLFQFYTQ